MTRSRRAYSIWKTLSSTDLFIELIKKRPTSYMTELFPNPGKP